MNNHVVSATALVWHSSSKKHGRTERQTSRGVASRAPANGQAALDRSIDPDPDEPVVVLLGDVAVLVRLEVMPVEQRPRSGDGPVQDHDHAQERRHGRQEEQRPAAGGGLRKHIGTMDEINWATGEGLLAVDDPSEVDDAFARNEKHVGIAVVGLSLNNEDLDAVAPRVVRAIASDDVETRRLGFTAAGHTARLFGVLDPRIERVLHRFRDDGIAATALDDVLQYVRFRQLPFWLKAQSVKRKLRWWIFRR